MHSEMLSTYLSNKLQNGHWKKCLSREAKYNNSLLVDMCILT